MAGTEAEKELLGSCNGGEGEDERQIRSQTGTATAADARSDDEPYA
jgi:hypothetical protein